MTKMENRIAFKATPAEIQKIKKACLNLSKNISIVDNSVLNVYKRQILDDIFDSYLLVNKNFSSFHKINLINLRFYHKCFEELDIYYPSKKKVYD